MKVKLVAGMISSSEKVLDSAGQAMEAVFGGIDYASGVMPFDRTDYYRDEMGVNLLRKIVSFGPLFSPENLAEAKIAARGIERSFCSDSGGRRVNIDPGYVEGAKLVLATTKNYDHRIYLKDGIFAEVTLHFRGGTFIPWEWTYPDYRTEAYIEVFNAIRELYMRDLRTRGQDSG